jgi:hypothetical protein
VLTPHGKSTLGFGGQWCAYHDNATFNGQSLAYANIPYQPDAGTSCGMNFVNPGNDSFGHGYFDGFSIVGGHEYAEAISDAYPSSVLAWVDSQGSENGDKCAWSQGPGRSRPPETSLWAVSSSPCSRSGPIWPTPGRGAASSPRKRIERLRGG